MLAFPAVTGCGGVSTTVKVPVNEIRPAKEATRAELVAAYNHLAAKITSINASVTLTPTAGSAYSGVIQEYHEVNAFILAQKPATIRMIGQAPVLAKNVFDMTSDGQTFHIYIPTKNKFIVGPSSLERSAEKPIENLRPQHLLDALFWPQIPDVASVLFEENEDTSTRYYVLTETRNGTSPEIERILWFDRSDLNLARVQIYATRGRLVSDIHLGDWRSTSAGTPYPWDITLNRPHDDYRLDIHVTKLALNESISEDRFRLEQPPGTELVKLDKSGTGSQK
jgi:outer membrane lipoprotein-sorting protein